MTINNGTARAVVALKKERNDFMHDNNRHDNKHGYLMALGCVNISID